LFLLLCLCTASPCAAQDLSGIEIHGFVTQGFLYSSHNNYLTMQSSSGSVQWTEGAVSFSDALTDNLRAGIQLHMYQLGQLGGPNIQVDWASGDYRVNDYFGIRAGKVKTAVGLFNDSQDVDAIFLWTLLPQSVYPIDDRGFFLSHLGGEVYGHVPLPHQAGSVKYDGYAGQVTLDLNGGFALLLAQAGLVFTEPPSGKAYGGDLRWINQGLTVGASGYVQTADGKALNGNEHLAPFFVSGEYAKFEKGKYFVAGEYRRIPSNPVVTIGTAIVPIPLDQRGWFGMASYQVSRKIQLGSYYSHYVNKAGDPSQPANYSKDFVLSGRYDFNRYFYGKIEEHFLHGTGLGYYASTNPQGLQPNSSILAAKIGFSF
jgi:hypothetical protein